MAKPIKKIKSVKPENQNIASIILGSLSIVPLFWIFPIGIIFGIIGLMLHDKNGDKIGFGLSLAGTIIGSVWLLIWIGVIIFAVNS
jgi:ABC-type dipeptide/oligopeptide/nickel transport system permease component